jgi:hypothetical protein
MKAFLVKKKENSLPFSKNNPKFDPNYKYLTAMMADKEYKRLFNSNDPNPKLTDSDKDKIFLVYDWNNKQLINFKK